jgi:hypothetical protein
MKLKVKKMKRKIKDYGLKIKEARIARIVKHSRLAKKITDSRLGRKIYDLRFRIYETRIVRKIKHLRISRKVKKHKKLSVSLLILLVAIPLLVGVFAYIQHRNNERFATDVPYQEKIADGAWILHNQEPIRQVVNKRAEVDLTLKEVMNVMDFVRPNSASADVRTIADKEASSGESDIARPFDSLKYRWMVQISTGTYFEFGGVDASTPDGKVLPVVRVRNSDGAYVAFAPKFETPNSKSETNPNSEIINPKSSILNQYVTPSVKGNVISWEIGEGITARYTMMQDRVKADYIVNEKSNLKSNQLDFDLEYSRDLGIIELPDGSLSFSEGTDEPERTASLQEIFQIPVSEIIDNNNYKYNGEYNLVENENGRVLQIILPEDKLRQSSFPLTIDPVLVATPQPNSINYENGRNIVMDAWGNLIVVFASTGRGNMYYKNYNSNTWVNTDLDLDYVTSATDPESFAADIDSYGDLHIAFEDDASLYYARLNVSRDQNNAIEKIHISDQQLLDGTASGGDHYPSLIIVNKGAGEGKEKVVISNAVTNTGRNETRVFQKDVWNVGYEDMMLEESNLVGYWRLNSRTGGTIAFDYSATDNDGTIYNSPSLEVEGAILGDSENTAVTFNGSTQYISMPDNDAYDFGTGDFSLEAWFKRSADPSKSEYILGHAGGGTSDEWELFMGTGCYISSRIGGGSNYNTQKYDICDGDWHHVVFAVDRDGTGTYYIDGEIDSVHDVSADSSKNLTNTDSLYIGSRLPAGNEWTGSLDEIAIYKGRVLSASDVLRHYNKAKETNYSNTILNTSGLSAYYRLGDSLNYTKVIQSMDPKGYWPMDDDSGDFIDATGNGFTATSNGPPDYQQTGPTINGDTYSAVRFQRADSPDEYATFSNTIDDNVTTSTGMTISGWFKIPLSSNSEPIIGQMSSTTNLNSWNIRLNTDSSFSFYTYDTDGVTYSHSCQSTGGPWDDNNWHHFVAWIDADGNANHMIDGLATRTNTCQAPASGKSWNAETSATGAIAAFSGTGASRADVTVAHIAYWDSVLSDGEREALYDVDVAYDLSGNGNHGAYNNTPTKGVSGATGSDFDTAVTLNGSTQDITASGSADFQFGTGDFSWEAWIKRSTLPSSNQEVIMALRGEGNPDDWVFKLDNTAGNCLFAQWNGTGSYYGGCSAGFNDNRWHHVVFTADRDGSGTFYVDGKESGQWDISGTSSDNLLTNSQDFIIGDRASGGLEWDGSIDEVAIYKGVALTADQVMEHYQAANGWKNVSEEINSNGTCSESYTRGEVGFASSLSCRGTADRNFYVGTNSRTHSMINQMPGTPPRTPDSVKFDDNGSFSDLSNTIDGNRGSTNEVNSFTTTDYLYVGDSKPFSKVTVDMVATNSATADFATTDVEYCSLSYDGTTCTTWSDLSNFYDYTDNGTSAFSEDGSLLFDEPDNWTTVTVNSTADKYWIRIRPDAAMDTDVKIAEITVNHRNSNALVLIGGSISTNGYKPAVVPWDDITNEGWENRADSTGIPWIAGTATNFWGTIDDEYFTYFTYLFDTPLSSTVDYSNNRVYYSMSWADWDDLIYGGNTVLHYTFSVGINKDPTAQDSWIDAQFPGGVDKNISNTHHSMTSDGKDIYVFIEPDESDTRGGATLSAYFVRCTPHAASDPEICDNENDWGEEVKLAQDVLDSMETLDVISTKVTSDLTAIDLIYDGGANPVYYERFFVDSNDRKKIGASSGDDGFHRDCDSGTHDQDISSIFVRLGRVASDGDCTSGNSENHAGFRFQNVDVAPGAKISSAYIDFQVATRSGSTAIDFNIYGEDTDNSSAYAALTNCTPSSTCTGIVDERTKTTSSVSQSINFEGTGNEGISYRFDVTDIVQEIVCRGVIGTQPCVGDFNGTGTWSSGNALSIILESIEGGSSNNWINIFSYDDTQGTLEPTLHINCGDSCDEPKPQEAEWCSLGGVNGNGSNDCNNNWQSRKKITFDNRASAENLTEFPTLIRLDSTKIDYSKVQNAGQDLRFVDATGGAVLRYDIDEWDETGESLVWVRVPQIDAGSNTDYIYMYYNNTSASAGMNEEETYESNIEAVYHLHEDPTSICSGTDEVCDSTSNNIHLDDNGFMDSDDLVDGVLGKAINFNGTDEGLLNSTISISNLPGGNSSRTMEAWFRTTHELAFGKALFGYGVQTDPQDIAMIVKDGQICVDIRGNHGCFGTLADTYNDGQWHHAVITYDTTNFKLYVDGVKTGTDYNPATNPNTSVATGSFQIGVWASWHEGGIDEVRVHTGERSADYIEASYLTMRPGSTFASFGEEEADPSTSDYEALIKSNPDLVGYWRLGEVGGTVAYDETSNDADLTYTNSPTLGVTGAIKGDKNTAVTFAEASLQRAQNFTLDISHLPGGNSPRSLEGWFKTDWNSSTGDKAIIGYGHQVDPEDIHMSVRRGQFCINVRSNGNCATMGTYDEFNDDVWHHGVYTYDGTYWRGYIDGERIYSDWDPVTDPNTDVIDGNVKIGLWSDYFEGELDDVAIYSDVLSDEEILAHYETGRASLYQNTVKGTDSLVGYWRFGEGGGTVTEDSSSFSNDGTYTGSPTFGVSGALKGDNDTAVLIGSGVTDFATIPDDNSLDVGDTFTLDFWVKQNGGYNRCYFYKGTGGLGVSRNTDGTVGFSKIGTGTIARTTSTVGPFDSEWSHIAFTKNGSDSKVYFNGEEDTDFVGNQTISDTADDLYIGACGSAGNGIGAYMDDMAFYDEALSADEIKERYLAGGGTNRYNLRQFSKGVSTATGSASFSDLDAKFSSADYVAVSGNDETYVDLSADVNVSRNPDLNPMFMLKVNNAKNKNSDRINATAVVKSSVPTSINPIYMQVYNADVGNWVTIATDASSKADTDITLTGVTINANLQSYYINETSGVGTVGDLCTDGSSNCWTYFRIYQDTVDDSYNTILSLDAFDESFDSVPSTLAFTNAWNYIPTNTCSGSSGSFTVQMQDENGSVATPTQLTTVRITSNTGGTLTVYSDSACINPVTNGDLIFTTSDTSKTFYIRDTGISNDYTLTATAQSGDTISAGTGFYTIEGGLRLDSRTRIKGGGDTRIRGGTRFR